LGPRCFGNLCHVLGARVVPRTSSPEIRENVNYKDNTAASITNGCGTKVDVRICLMTEKGWNCGVSWGVAPQASWSWSSFHATGGVFVDAKVTGSGGKLASPN